MAGQLRRAQRRRGILIELVPAAAERHIGPLFAPMSRAMAELCARYGDAELAVVADFAAQAVTATRAATAEVRAGVAAGSAG